MPPPARWRRWRASSRRLRARWPKVRDRASRRHRLLPRRPDELVRGQPRALSCSGSRATGGWSPMIESELAEAEERARTPAAAGAPLQGLQVVDARQLVARAPCRRQGRVDARRGQPALHRHLARRRGGRRAASTRRSTASAATWRTGSRSARLDLFADRTSTATMRANQLRLWFASFAYVLLCALRRIALAGTQFAGHLRHDPAEAPQDRRAGARLGPPRQARHGLVLPQPARIQDRARPARRGRALTNQTAHSPHSPRPRAAPRRRPPIRARNHAKRTAKAYRAISPSRSEPSKIGSRTPRSINRVRNAG